MEDNSKLLNERLARVKAAIKRTEGDRVPVAIAYNTYGAFHYGYNLQDLHELYYEHPERHGEIGVKFAQEYPCDGYISIGSKDFASAQFFNGGFFVLNDMGLEVSNTICNIEGPEVYDELIKDARGYCSTVYFAKKFNHFFETATQEEALVALKKSQEFRQFYGAKAKEAAMQIEACGMPMLSNGGIVAPIDIILDFFRDFKGIVVDMRRCPDKLEAASKALEDFFLEVELGHFQGKDDGRSLYWTTHLATYLSPKQYARFYHPHVIKVCEEVIKKNGVLNLFMEGDWTKLYDQMQDIPDNDGNIMGMHEKCDMKEFKKLLGHKLCVTGGITTDMLRVWNVNQVVTECRRIIDDCAPGGGFIFNNAAMLIGESDVKPENLKAIISTVQEYGKY